ncbi:ammonia-forming cytochrome c nitrite reductase subunit c552 [candidate division KSB1 bacterium]|nr:ammonia-forming cytochrome c nitrite reductase subunit c552 [candidate division KSB1 bacterium]
MSIKDWLKRGWVYILIFLGSVIGTVLILMLLFNIREKKREALQYPFKVVEIGEDEIDPAVWGQNFPFEYDTFVQTKVDYGKTKYGGSTPYSKLEAYPAMKRLWAGYSFSKDHNEERGHHYTSIDQANTLRTQIVVQPGACVNCHAAEMPALVREMGWEEFNATPYNDLKSKLMTGSSCADCHDPNTMALRITRPAFKIAMEEAGVDLSKATRQEMRSYVCGQCHVEYYFKGKNKVLTFPWSEGRSIDAIKAHYESYDFADWTHAETGAPMLKMQHPEFELWGTGIHAKSGVSCADCHMPYVRRGSVKISDHWIRSPLQNPNASCQTCHHVTVEELEDRILTIQDRTAKLLRQSEEAILDAIDAIKVAQSKGIPSDKLDKALHLHRRSQMRWDFVSSENSTGFHSGQEAARILAESMDLARQAQIEAIKTLNRS